MSSSTNKHTKIIPMFSGLPLHRTYSRLAGSGWDCRRKRAKERGGERSKREDWATPIA